MKVTRKTQKNSVNGNRGLQSPVASLGQTSVLTEDSTDRHHTTRKTKTTECCICKRTIQDDREESVWCHRGGSQHLKCSSLISVRKWTTPYECQKCNWCVPTILPTREIFYEAEEPQAKLSTNKKLKIASWNVRTLCQKGKIRERSSRNGDSKYKLMAFPKCNGRLMEASRRKNTLYAGLVKPNIKRALA